MEQDERLTMHQDVMTHQDSITHEHVMRRRVMTHKTLSHMKDSR